jgi:branched-chain amino acid transport system permease protein
MREEPRGKGNAVRLILEILVYGAVQSAIYALLATGFSLIFGVAGIVNLAHTAFYMIGAYLIYTFFTFLHLPLALAILLSILLVAFIAILVHRLCIEPLITSEWSVMIITVSLALFFQQFILTIFGPADRNVKGFFERKLSLFGQVDIDGQRLLSLFMAVGIIALLWLFINRTKVGRSVKAVSQNREAALLMGIEVRRVYFLVMGISAGLAAIAGAFIAPILGARPHMWETVMPRVFAVVVLGGLGSLEGTLLAAIIIAYCEVSVSFWVSSYFGEIVPLIIILLILSFRPTGLMGKRTEV